MGGGGGFLVKFTVCQCQINKKEKTILKNKNYTVHGPPNKNPGTTVVFCCVFFFFLGGGGGGLANQLQISSVKFKFFL